MSQVSLLKNFAGESVVYGISGILSRFLAVFLTPIYTRIFMPSDYGVISLVTNVSALLSILVILGLDNSMARWYYDNEDENDRKITLNTFLWSCGGIAALFALFIYCFRDFIAVRIMREPATAPLLLLMAANLPLTIFSVFTTNVLRMQRRATATTVFTLTVSLINISLNVLFVIMLRRGVAGVFYAQLLTSIVAVVWTLVLFGKQMSPRLFNFKRWREMLVFSLPLVPGSVAFWVINLSGAYFIQLMGSTGEVGLFQIGTMLASVVAMFTGAFQMAWGPFAYSIYKRPEAKQLYAGVMLVFLSITCLMSLGLMLFAREALMILTTRDYLGAATVAGLLAFNHVLIGLGYIASIGTGIAKNNKAYGIAMLVSAGILVALNLILVPRYGKEGAAISILLSQSIVPIAIFWHGQLLYPIPYKFGKAIAILGTSFVFGTGANLLFSIWSLSLVATLAVKILLLMFYCALVFFAVRSEIGRTSGFLTDAPAV